MRSTLRRRTAPILAAVLFSWFLAASFASAADKPAAKPWPSEWDGCTSIEVGRLASVDGSVMTCHTCDGPYRTWLTIVPRQKWPDKAMTKVYSGRMHTETPADLQGIVQTGEIPQALETFQFLNTAYPCLTSTAWPSARRRSAAVRNSSTTRARS